jgi:hypothetical protein
MALSTVIQDVLEKGSYHRLLAFDIEAYECNHGMLLELGMAVHELGSEDPVEAHHFVFKENQYSRNGRYCADNRNNFAFGETIIAGTCDILSALIKEISIPGTALVGHNLKSDLRFMNNAMVGTMEQSLIHQFFSSMRLSFDTQLLFKSMTGSSKPSKLEAIINALGVHCDFMHNAGNDAYYTLVAFLKLADLPFVREGANPPKTLLHSFRPTTPVLPGACSKSSSDAGSENLSFDEEGF